MAKTETFRVPKKCQCGATGAFVFEENENPAHHGGELNTRLIAIDGPFKHNDDGTAQCLQCGYGKPHA